MRRADPDGLKQTIREIAYQTGRKSATSTELFHRFVTGRDEDAFRSIVHLHSQLVWGVAWRILGNRSDAEDVFQATFIVFFRKAHRVNPPEQLPAWLYGVAIRAAKKVRQQTARRREILMGLPPEPIPRSEAPPAGDLRGVLDEEIERLAPPLRQVVILCHLEGRTYADAARSLGCGVSTVADRLDRATAILRIRFRRRGLAPEGLAVGFGMAATTGEGLACTSELVVRQVLGLSGASPSPAASEAATAVIRTISGGWGIRGTLAVVAALGLGTGWMATASVPAEPRHAPPKAVSAVAFRPRVDSLGDPLPAGAVARLGTTRFRPAGQGDRAAMAFLGRAHLVSAHGRDVITVWDARTGQVRAEIPAPAGCDRVDVSADGSRMVAVGQAEVWAWRLSELAASRIWVRQRLGNGTLPAAVGFTQDASAVVLSEPDAERMSALAAASGEVLASCRAKAHGPLGFPAGTREVVAVAGDDGIAGEVARRPRPTHSSRLLVWDLATGHMSRVLDMPDGETLMDYDLSPDGRSVVCVGMAGGVSLIDTRSGRQVSTWRHPAAPHLTAFLDQTTVIELGPWGIKHRDVATGMVTSLAGDTRLCLSTAVWGAQSWSKQFCRDTGRLAVAANRAIMLWDAATGRSFGPDSQLGCDLQILGFSPDGRTVTTRSELTDVRVWEAATGVEVCRLHTPDLIPWVAPGLLSEQAGRTALTGGIEQQTAVNSLNGQRGTVSLLSATKPGSRFVARILSNRVVVEDAAGRSVAVVATDGPTESAQLSTDGRMLLVVRPGHKTAAVWSLDETKMRIEIPPPGSSVDWLHFQMSPDGSVVAAVTLAPAVKQGMRGHHSRVVLWDVKSATSVEHDFPSCLVTGVSLSHAGGVVAVGTADGQIHVWRPHAVTVRSLSGHRGPVTSAAFSPDSRLLATASEDGTVLIWAVP